MDSCEHDFLIAISGKRSYLLHHILLFSAAYPPSGIGNDTVGAELVAAILYFDISPGVFTCTGKVKRFVFFCPVNISDLTGCMRAGLLSRLSVDAVFSLFSSYSRRILTRSFLWLFPITISMQGSISRSPAPAHNTLPPRPLPPGSVFGRGEASDGISDPRYWLLCRY